WLPTDPAIPTAERPGHAEIRYHALGTDSKTDAVVHERLDNPEVFLGVDLSRDGRWLMAYVWHGWSASDIYIRDLQAENTSWTPFVVGIDAQFSVIAWEDHFYIITDEEAPKKRVLRAPAGHADRSTWTEIIPESADATLDDVSVLGGRLVLTTLRDAYSQLVVHELDGTRVREVELPAIGAVYGVTGNPEDDTLYFSFNAMTIPYRIYTSSVRDGGSSVWAEVDVKVDPEPYQVEQVWYTSRDGTRVSMFILRRRDAPRDGSTPFMLYGYGGFNVNMKPYFRASIYPWLEAGGGYALPNLRGGGEYGEAWHRDGMLTKKQNVFDDFIAAAEYLIAEGYTAPERLAIRGGSNGGLLVGAAMTQRPELFGAVVCAAPLLDMVRYHLFGSGKTWISEYGSADDEEQFRALYAYSPYHNVKPGLDYPSMLMLSPEHDDRVDPLHARKMVAALQTADPGDAREPILLRVERDAGHGGADLVRQHVALEADVNAFLMRLFEMTPQ
ncbi:MAG: prolyl oligopeptidase family serine peptidase, partial [Myxococcota bacterium]